MANLAIVEQVLPMLGARVGKTTWNEDIESNASDYKMLSHHSETRFDSAIPATAPLSFTHEGLGTMTTLGSSQR